LQWTYLPELITKTEKEYINLAVRLYENPEELKKIKEKLLRNKNKSPLFDTKGLTREIENSYIKVWKDYLQKKGRDGRK